jgi:hypothetical protein
MAASQVIAQVASRQANRLTRGRGRDVGEQTKLSGNELHADRSTVGHDTQVNSTEIAA